LNSRYILSVVDGAEQMKKMDEAEAKKMKTADTATADDNALAGSTIKLLDFC